MRFSLKASGLLALLLLALSLVGGTGVGAQDTSTEGLQPGDLEGLQHSVVRAYTIDYSAMLDAMATPGAEMAMPEGIFMVGATVLEFDNDEHADTALTLLAEETAAEDQVAMGEDAEVTEIELDLGDRSSSYKGIEEIDGQEAETVVSLIQDGNYVYFVVVAGSGIDIQQATTDFATLLIDTEGSGAGEFNADGTSTGGLWDKFPAADHELLAGLIAYDEVLFPISDSTPES